MNIAGRLGPAAILLTLTTFVSSQTISGGGSKDTSPQLNGVDRADASGVRASDPLFDLPCLKERETSLIGGVIENVDQVRDRLILRPFGGRKLEIVFDPRTQFIRGGEAADAWSLRRGDRVHVETVLDGTRVFAKRIHLPSDAVLGEAQGQVLAYDAAAGRLTIRDELTSQPIQFVLQNKSTGGTGLAPGALVRVDFLPNADRAVARKVRVMAAPGAVFTFVGRVTYLDLASRQLVVASTTDNKKYQIQFSPVGVESRDHLREGAEVIISARFDGQHYIAESVTVSPVPIR